jgi:hypothetical protein
MACLGTDGSNVCNAVCTTGSDDRGYGGFA